MIFYFTGTGNSLYVAKQMEEEQISIPQIIRKDELSFSADCIGIVCPIYGHEMPMMVKDFLKKTEFNTSYLYLLLTYGNAHGGSAEIAKKYCDDIGIKVDYINTILMVDNFLPAFDMKEQMAIDKKVEEQIAQIKEDIQGKKVYVQKAGVKDKATHKMYTAWVKNAPETIWADYVITDKCIGCGICTKVCPAGCIHLENQHAVNTGKNCQACYACVQACPEMAIQFGDIPMKEPNPNARYRNPNVTLTELVTANNQTEQ